MISERAKLEAQAKFERQFRRAVLERIDRERLERLSKSPAELTLERNAMIETLAKTGRPCAEIATALQTTVVTVRKVLGLERGAEPPTVKLAPLPLKYHPKARRPRCMPVQLELAIEVAHG